MFRFTIRDVLWLTVVVGLTVALWLNHRNMINERQTLEIERKSLASKTQELDRKWEQLRRSADAIIQAQVKQSRQPSTGNRP